MINKVKNNRLNEWGTINMLEKILDGIRRINENIEDPELAHIIEDDLYEEFVRFICNNTDPPFRDYAKLLLTTKNMDFSRWYA